MSLGENRQAAQERDRQQAEADGAGHRRYVKAWELHKLGVPVMSPNGGPDPALTEMALDGMLAGEKGRRATLYQAFARAGIVTVFRALDVQILTSDGIVYTIGNHDALTQTNSSRPLGLLAGAEAMVTDGLRELPQPLAGDNRGVSDERARAREPSQETGAAALSAGWSHGHRDVSGGWLRPTVFGAVDGLVTTASLIAGVGGGGVSAHAIVLTGVAALVAGAFSMGTGEYISVTNQNELVHAEVALERQMLARFPAAEQDELAGYFRSYGADPDTAARMAAAVSQDPGTALRVHAREELGIDPHDLPSPLLAGTASLLAFSFGALIPLLPYLLGYSVLAATLVITAVALVTGGAVVGRLTGRSMIRSGLRQLALGGIAIAVTYTVGSLIGGHPA